MLQVGVYLREWLIYFKRPHERQLYIKQCDEFRTRYRFIMKLKLVKKNGAAVRPLEEKENTAFRAVANGDPYLASESLVIDVLKSARKEDQWLKCDCKNNNGPILVPCLRSDTGMFYLRTLSRKNLHEEGCELYGKPIHCIPANLWDEKRKARKPPEGYFAVLQEIFEVHGLADKNTTQPSRNKARGSPRRPALSQQLLRVMENAELNKLSSADRFADRRNWYNDISEIISAIKIAPNILLSKLWFSDVRMWNDGTVHKKMTEASKEWPKGHKPQGFLCWLVWDVDKDGVGLKKDNNRVDVINGVNQPIIHGNPVSKPYLFLGVVGLPTNEKSGYQCIAAYAQPIVASDCPIPVDSHYERVALGKIKYQLRQILDDYPDVEFEITKPVFEIETKAGPCLPDFIITARRGKNVEKFIIEVMGFERSDYLEGKEVTHPRMKTLGTLITMDASKFTKKSGAKTDGAKVRKIICDKLQLTH